LIAKSRFEPCRRSLSHRRSVSVAARLADNEQGLVRFQDLRYFMPPWSSGSDAGFSARKRGFESRRGFFRLAVGETVTPPVSGTGDRWFDSSRPDLHAARWRSGSPREPHELETWVRIPPAQFFGGVAQRPEHSLVRRVAAGSTPVVPARG